MRILWSSNSAWARTGYGVQTKLALQKLKPHHTMGLFAWYGLDGGMIHMDGVPVYPKGTHPYGADMLGSHAHDFNADIVITLIDAWVQEPQALPQDVRWIPLYPVDHEPLPSCVHAKVRDAFARINFSKFGVAQTEAVGLDTFYVPHMVDTGQYKPYAQDESRKDLNLPEDRFIVGVVAANKGYPARKSWPEIFQAFAEFRKTHPDAFLFAHTNHGRQDGMGGWDIANLIDFFGLSGHVAIPEQYAYQRGLPEDFMARLFSSFDVLLNPAMGEGFGVPIVEAQACGCPVIVGDWTAMSEVCGAGWKIPKHDAVKTLTLQMAYQWLPTVPGIVNALTEAYNAKGDVFLREKARLFAVENYDADRVTAQHWIPVLKAIEERVTGAKSLEKRFAASMGGVYK